MVQIIPYKGHAGYLAEALGQTLGEGLGSFTGSYFANKAIEKVMNDPALKDAPLSERQGRLQAALAPYGERGQRLLQQRLQIEQQKQAENMFKKIKGLSPNATPQEIMSTIAEASAGVPGAEKWVAPMTEMLLKQRSANPPSVEEKESMTKNQPSPPSPGFLEKGSPARMSEGAFAEGEPTGLIPAVKELSVQPEELTMGLIEELGDRYYPNVQRGEEAPIGETRKPTKPPMPMKPIGPQEVLKMRNWLYKKGITNRDDQDEYIQGAKDYQKDWYTSQKEGYTNVEAYRGERIAEDNRFFGEAENMLTDINGAPMPKEAFNIWKGLARLNENAPSDEARFSDTQQMYNQLIGDPVAGFDSLSQPIPWFSMMRPGATTEYLENNRDVAQDHLKHFDSPEFKEQVPDDRLRSEMKNYARQKYRESMAAKGWGTAQSAYAISNLSNEMKGAIPKAPSPQEIVGTGGQMNYLPKDREKWVNQLAISLQKLKPDDSLILAREQALANNYDDQAFNEALRIVLRSGKLKLSDFQRMERPELAIPQRLDLDSVMSGKRSIFEAVRRVK